MRRNSLRQNVSWTFVGNIVYAAGQMLVFVLLAKLLDAERVGQYALGLAITTPLFTLFYFGLRPVLATDVRASFAFYNTEEEIDRLIEGLQRVKTMFA